MTWFPVLLVSTLNMFLTIFLCLQKQYAAFLSSNIVLSKEISICCFPDSEKSTVRLNCKKWSWACFHQQNQRFTLRYNSFRHFIQIS